MPSIIPPQKKPKNWRTLPLYKKVQVYQQYLGKFHAPFVDKLLAKKIVTEVCRGEILVAPVIRILASPNDLRPEDLCPNWIIKAAHASKWNINLQDRSESGSEYGPEKIPIMIQKLHQWNQTYSPGLEKQYQYIQPRFFIEEKIVDKYAHCYTGIGEKSDDAIVYMFRCIYGKVVSISARLGERRNDYNPHWEVIGGFDMPFIQKPEGDLLQRMIRNAERLSSPFEFVRMDFYLGAGDHQPIYFSEFTFSPTCGLPTLPGNLEYTLAKSWI